MSFFVFRPQPSTGAKQLAKALGGRRLRATEGGRVFRRNPRTGANIPVILTAADVVICWGSALQTPVGGRVLNGAPLRSKFEDAVLLRRAGVPTVEVSCTRPQAGAPQPVVDPATTHFERVKDLADQFSNLTFARGTVMERGIQELLQETTTLLGAIRTPAPAPRPAAPVGEWVPRLNNHSGGLDLLNPPATPNYWVKKEALVREFRVHSFNGLSIRAGVKAPREGFSEDGAGGTQRCHAWVRSWDGGWRILYDGVSAKQAQRDLAAQAVAALGLQFGAVDIGQRADGSLIVLEVNRAPGIEAGTIECYTRAITRWADGTLPAPKTPAERAAQTARRRARRV